MAHSDCWAFYFEYLDDGSAETNKIELIMKKVRDWKGIDFIRIGRTSNPETKYVKYESTDLSLLSSIRNEFQEITTMLINKIYLMPPILSEEI